MTQDEIIEMARQAGLFTHKEVQPEIMAFAKLVAEKEPVSMRMPKVGDRVICIEDGSLGIIRYLTGGGSPDITFDDGSHGTYLLRQFAELFAYATSPTQPAQRTEQNFCSRCGKRTPDLTTIHTCTPPKD